MPGAPAFIYLNSQKTGDVDLASLSKQLNADINITTDKKDSANGSDGSRGLVVHGNLVFSSSTPSDLRLVVDRQEDTFGFGLTGGYVEQVDIDYWKGGQHEVDIHLTNFTVADYEYENEGPNTITVDFQAAQGTTGIDERIYVVDAVNPLAFLPGVDDVGLNVDVDLGGLNTMKATLDISKDWFYDIHALNLMYEGHISVDFHAVGIQIISFEKKTGSFWRGTTHCSNEIHYELHAETPLFVDTQQAFQPETILLEFGNIPAIGENIAEVTTIHHVNDGTPMLSGPSGC